jgi:DNA-binding winged helix-turn-helix (wHTH) protein
MMVGSGLDYRILGAVEVWRDSRQVDIGGPRQRALLGLLILHRNRVVSTDRLIDLLWGERPPSTAANTLHVLISHLRRALNGDGGEAVLVTRRPGYELHVAPGCVDLERLESLYAEATVAANATDYQRASARLGEALVLWRDDPMPELVDVSELAGELGRIRELRMAALEGWFDAELALGRHRQIHALPRPDQFALDISGAGFDLADEGFDFPNPDPSMLEFPLLQEAGMHQTVAMRRADHTPAPTRYAAWRRIELSLVRGSSPLIAYAVTNTFTLASPSVGCLSFQPEYGIDLTRLGPHRTH